MIEIFLKFVSFVILAFLLFWLNTKVGSSAVARAATWFIAWAAVLLAGVVLVRWVFL